MTIYTPTFHIKITADDLAENVRRIQGLLPSGKESIASLDNALKYLPTAAQFAARIHEVNTMVNRAERDKFN